MMIAYTTAGPLSMQVCCAAPANHRAGGSDLGKLKCPCQMGSSHGISSPVTDPYLPNMIFPPSATNGGIRF
jgi:hypothetical protein